MDRSSLESETDAIYVPRHILTFARNSFSSCWNIIDNRLMYSYLPMRLEIVEMRIMESRDRRGLFDAWEVENTYLVRVNISSLGWTWQSDQCTCLSTPPHFMHIKALLFTFPQGHWIKWFVCILMTVIRVLKCLIGNLWWEQNCEYNRGLCLHRFGIGTGWCHTSVTWSLTKTTIIVWGPCNSNHVTGKSSGILGG